VGSVVDPLEEPADLETLAVAGLAELADWVDWAVAPVASADQPVALVELVVSVVAALVEPPEAAWEVRRPIFQGPLEAPVLRDRMLSAI
jgi:hypothetical protein